MRSKLAFLIAAMSSLSACGDQDDLTLCETNGISVRILENHPSGSHELTVPVSDVLAAIEVTYDIQGLNTGHGHTVTITPPSFAALQDGAEVTVTSSNNGAVGMNHTHDVVLSCTP